MTRSEETIATEREVEQWPGASVAFELGGRHIRCILSFGGSTRLVIASLTGSDWRGIKNHLSTVRKELAAMGAQRLAQPKRTGPRPERIKPHRPMRCDPAPLIDNPLKRLSSIINEE